MSSPNAKTAQLSIREVLANTAFRRLWLAQCISIFGDFLAAFAILNVASFRLNATPSEITWVTISYMGPTALLAPIVGVFVDRWPLKPTLIASDLIRACIAVTYLFATKLSHFYMITVALAIVSTFFTPAQGVGVRLLVPREGLLSANTLMQQIMFVMRIAGPGLAGLVIRLFGSAVCYAVDVASFLASAALLSTIPLTRPATPPVETPGEAATGVKRVWLDFRAGFDFLVHHGAVLFVVLAMASGIFAIGCFGPLIAVHVRDNLHAGTVVFSAASALIGAGMFAGVTFLRRIADRFSHTQLVYSGLGGMAIFVAFLGVTSTTPITLACCFLIGLCVGMVIVPAQVLLQSETPQHLMGRVGSTVLSSVFAAQVVGLLLSGELARLTSIRQVFFVTSALLLIIMAVGRVFLHHRAAGTTMYPEAASPKT